MDNSMFVHPCQQLQTQVFMNSYLFRDCSQLYRFFTRVDDNEEVIKEKNVGKRCITFIDSKKILWETI